MKMERKFFTIDEIFRIIEESINRSLRQIREIIGSEEYIPERTLYAPFDIIDEGDKYIIEIDMPGLRKEDIILELRDHKLTIKGERKGEIEKKGKNYIRRERKYIGFYREILLPEDIDVNKIKAKYENGVLRIEIAKKPGSGKRIEIE